MIWAIQANNTPDYFQLFVHLHVEAQIARIYA